MSASGKSFEDITARLDEIVAAVRSKDTSLERSLDLFDEAIELGAQAVDLVDGFEFSEREEELLDGGAGAVPEDGGGSGADGGGDAAAAGAGDGGRPAGATG